MRPQVLVEVTLLTRPVGAEGARVRPLARVRSEVEPKVVPPLGLLRAQRALIELAAPLQRHSGGRDGRGVDVRRNPLGGELPLKGGDGRSEIPFVGRVI